MPHPKQSEVLLAKAEQDEYLLDKILNDPNAPWEIFGFHAQQAAEKLLKAALAGRGVDYPPTHRLKDLLKLIQAQGLGLPACSELIRQLTPFAVEYRYDLLPPELEEPLDKGQVRQALRELRAWVENLAKAK